MGHDDEDPRGRRVVRVTVSGRVQGVGFRAWTERQALMRGVEGWVRNRRDGAVEAIFAGDPDSVAALVEASARGPLSARVQGVNVEDAAETELDLRNPGTSFDVLGTA